MSIYFDQKLHNAINITHENHEIIITLTSIPLTFEDAHPSNQWFFQRRHTKTKTKRMRQLTESSTVSLSGQTFKISNGSWKDDATYVDVPINSLHGDEHTTPSAVLILLTICRTQILKYTTPTTISSWYNLHCHWLLQHKISYP